MTAQSFYKYLIILVFFGIWAFAAPARAGVQIEQLRLSLNGQMTRVVIDLSSPAGMSVQLYENPDRVEINIPGGMWAAPGFTPGDKSFIREFSADTDTITLYLREQAVIANMFALAPDGPRPDRLVLDLKSATPAEYAIKLGQVSRLNTPLQNILSSAQTTTKTTVGKLVDKNGTTTVTKTVTKTEVKTETPKKTAPAHKPLIVIDAGHGGQDPGAIGRGGVREKDITLAVAKALRDALVSSKNYRVVMTRDTDVFLKLADRVKVGQRNKADLFVSLHADTVGENSDPELTRGASIYTISDTASDQVSARLAARENKADLLGGKPDLAEGAVGTILLDLLNQETMMRSKDFASAIERGFGKGKIIMVQRPLRSAGFAVLKGADFPSALIEMGFLSSPKDGNLLQQKDYQQNLAKAIMGGIDDFFANDKLASLTE